jgi:hypothetical protein
LFIIEPRTQGKYLATVQCVTWQFGVPVFALGDINFVVDGKSICGHYILAVINNIHLYMGGLVQLSPRIFLDDGLMDLWLFQDNLQILFSMHGIWYLVSTLALVRWSIILAAQCN